MAIDCAPWFSVVYLVCTLWSVQAMQCKGSANYTLVFQGEWSNMSHPKDYPSNASFSSLVGCSHNASYVMWRSGEKATTGVKNFVETGGYVELHNEIDDQIASRNVHKSYHDSSMIHGTANRTITNIEVDPEYPFVSFITKISPSPDWFVGVHDYNLCNTTTGDWVETITRDLLPYDAGTDSGLDFESINNRTTPAEKIYRITNNTEGSFKGNKPVKSLAFVTFSLIPHPPSQQTTTKHNVPTTLPKPTSKFSPTSRGSKPRNATSSAKLAAFETANLTSTITPALRVANKSATPSVNRDTTQTMRPTSTTTPTLRVTTKGAETLVKQNTSQIPKPTSTITPASRVPNKRTVSLFKHGTTQKPNLPSKITPTSTAGTNKIALSSVKHGTTQKPNPPSKITSSSTAGTNKIALSSVKHGTTQKPNPPSKITSLLTAGTNKSAESSVKRVSTPVATTKTTSGTGTNAFSVKQFGFIYVAFALILNLLL